MFRTQTQLFPAPHRCYVTAELSTSMALRYAHVQREGQTDGRAADVDVLQLVGDEE